ncbi:MAG TPA: hypothetical protein VFQ56_03895 [Flavobacterium sp.]|nr:hypothetical protein [Flavobacterium sp.]
MSNIINFEEIKLAKKVVKEVPEIVNNIDKCINLLYNSREYADVTYSLQQLNESKIMLQIYLETYKLVLEQNGVKKSDS